LQRIRIPLLLGLLLVLVAQTVIAAEAPPRPTGIHYVYLIRHGIYDRDSTADDVVGNGLNALGREQARLIGARLAALPVRPASLVASTYRRASETADVIGSILKMTPTRDSLIHECTPTTTRQDYMRNHSPEDIALCDSNLAAAWVKYMTPSPAADRHDVLVCHGNVIRALVSRAVSGDSRQWHVMDIGNASLTILAVRPDGSTRLVMFSDVGHLPLDRQSWTGNGAGWGTKAVRSR
jgi:serine/threonine-protein phosphatase PGAM5